MSQHDFDIANQGFPATRADLNNALKAAVSNSAGTSAPSTTYAYQFWYDSTNNIIKMRNGDNDAWISVATVDQTNDLVSITHTGMLDLVDDDGSASIRFQAPSTVTSTTTFTLPDGDGDSGQTLITNGSGTLSWHAPYGNRNLIINGAMQVAQRATSASAKSSAGYHVVDRFRFVNNTSTGAVDIEQSTTVPAGQGFGYSLKVSTSTAKATLTGTNEFGIQHRIEGQNLQLLNYGTSSASKATLSFWVRSNKTGTYVVWLYQTGNNRNIQKQFTISSANTWEKKELTIDGDTSGSLANDNSNELEFFIVLGTGPDRSSGTAPTTWQTLNNADRYVGQTVNILDSTSNTFYLTGVQLEIGSVSTPFEHRSFADELHRCSRYLKQYKATTLFNQFAFAHSNSTTSHNALFTFDPPMRDTPSAVTVGGNIGIITQWDLSVTGISAVALDANTKGFTQTRLVCTTGTGVGTAGETNILLSNNNASSTINFDAEL